MRRERGSITPLVALLVVAVGGLAVGLGGLGADAVEAARARTAADAAALAGAAGGEAEARSVAKANGAELVVAQVDGDTFLARARVGEAEATARAEGVQPSGGGMGAPRVGLDPAMAAALARAEALLGGPVPITSGWRSPAQQQALWDNRAANPYPVARPGTSAHERGLAVDVPRSFVDRLRSVAGPAGLCQPVAKTDPIHFELCRPINGS